MVEKAGAPVLIRTPDQKLRVFVSSTLRELAPEREAARAAIARLRLAPVLLKLGARPHPARELHCARLEKSHIMTSAGLADAGHRILDVDLRTLFVARRAEMERFSLVEPPPALGTRPAMSRTSRSTPGAHVEVPDLMRGSAGSTGIARGPAWIAHSLEEAGRLRRGEVLVAQTLSSSWTPLFALAAAIVTDTGGILSHAAVVAREYGIPAVLGTSVATTMVHEGQPLEVDGQQGTVRILDSAAAVEGKVRR